MTRLNVQFPDQIGRQFEPLPEGAYTLKIWDIKQKMSRATAEKPSSPYLEFVFQVEGFNRKLWDRFSLKDTAIWRLQQLLAVLGQPHTGPVDIDFDELIGLQVDAVVAHEEYQGKMQERVKEYRESQFVSDPSDDEVPF